MKSSVHMFVFAVVIMAMCIQIESAPLALASARQFLPPIPGYIPVFIRQGDEPLENINTDLAAAFRAYSAKHGINTGHAINEIEPKLPAKSKTSHAEPEHTSLHIQKIASNKNSGQA